MLLKYELPAVFDNLAIVPALPKRRSPQEGRNRKYGQNLSNRPGMLKETTTRGTSQQTRPNHGVQTMTSPASNSIATADFRTALLQTLEESFETVHGYFLDKGDSLFETLAGITAEEASQSLGPRSGNIAAKVNHIRFYLDAIAANAAAGEYIKVDWTSSWAVGEVNDTGWQDLIERLRMTYQGLRKFIETNEDWNEMFVGGAFGIVAHNAYHLGEIRQALAAIKPEE